MKQAFAAGAARVKMMSKKFLTWLKKHTPKVELLAKFTGATVAVIVAVSTLYTMLIGPAEADTADKSSSEYIYWRIERIADRIDQLERKMDLFEIETHTVQYSIVPPVDQSAPAMFEQESAEVDRGFLLAKPNSKEDTINPNMSVQETTNTYKKPYSLGWVYIGNAGSGNHLDNSKISLVVIPSEGSTFKPIEALPVRDHPIGMINNTEVLTFVDRTDSLIVEEVRTVGLRAHIWAKVASF